MYIALFGEVHEDAVMVYSNVAIIHHDKGDLDQALVAGECAGRLGWTTRMWPCPTAPLPTFAVN